MNIFVQLCLALKHVHDLRILHRDLKPQNVFLSQHHRLVKLGDFGISTVLRNSLAVARTQCGTPYYFSPELCMNQPYNSKSDVWAIGCILFELMSLRPAFECANIRALMHAICLGHHKPIPKQYSKPLQTLLSSMLHQDPEKRPAVADILKQEVVQTHLQRVCEQYTCHRQYFQQPHRAPLQDKNVNANPAAGKDANSDNVKRGHGHGHHGHAHGGHAGMGGPGGPAAPAGAWLNPQPLQPPPHHRAPAPPPPGQQGGFGAAVFQAQPQRREPGQPAPQPFTAEADPPRRRYSYPPRDVPHHPRGLPAAPAPAPAAAHPFAGLAAFEPRGRPAAPGAGGVPFAPGVPAPDRDRDREQREREKRLQQYRQLAEVQQQRAHRAAQHQQQEANGSGSANAQQQQQQPPPLPPQFQQARPLRPPQHGAPPPPPPPPPPPARRREATAEPKQEKEKAHVPRPVVDPQEIRAALERLREAKAERAREKENKDKDREKEKERERRRRSDEQQPQPQMQAQAQQPPVDSNNNNKAKEAEEKAIRDKEKEKERERRHRHREREQQQQQQQQAGTAKPHSPPATATAAEAGCNAGHHPPQQPPHRHASPPAQVQRVHIAVNTSPVLMRDAGLSPMACFGQHLSAGTHQHQHHQHHKPQMRSRSVSPMPQLRSASPSPVTRTDSNTPTTITTTTTTTTTVEEHDYRQMVAVMQQLLQKGQPTSGGGARVSPRGSRDGELRKVTFAETQDEVFGDSLAQLNGFLSFRLDGRVLELPGVLPSDDLTVKCAALREHLVRTLGADPFDAVYRMLSDQGDQTEVGDTVLMGKALHVLGKDRKGYVQLVSQLIFCEGVCEQRATTGSPSPTTATLTQFE